MYNCIKEEQPIAYNLLHPLPVLLSVLVLEVVPLVSICLHRECEEVETSKVGDEYGVSAVPTIVSICHLGDGIRVRVDNM